MWLVIDDLLGRDDCVTGNTSLTADNCFQFSTPRSTAAAPEHTFTIAQPSCRLERFAEISEQDVIKR